MKYRVLDNEEEILQKIMEIASISNNNDNIIKSRFLQKLFFEYGINDVIIDPVGNVIAKIQGEKDGSIALFADLEDLNKLEVSKIKVTMKDIIGKGVGTNAFPLYTLTALAKIFKKSREKHKTMYFIGFAEGRTTFKGIKYFLKNLPEKIDTMIYLRGLEEGRLEKSTSSSINCEILFRDIDSNYIHEENKNHLFYGIAKLILKIKEEDTGEMFNFKIEAINNSNDINGKYILKVIITSETLLAAKQGFKILQEIVEGIKSEENLIIELQENSARDGVICKEDKLYSIFYEILKNREIKIYNISESSEIAVPISEGIETVYIGIGKGGNFNRDSEYLEIKSIYRGIELIYEALTKYDDN